MAAVDVREKVEQIARRYIDLLNKEMNISAAYIYGSYIKGNFDEDSDIDIAVVSEDFTGDIVEDTFKLMKFRRKIDNRIEPHPFCLSDFNNKNPFIKEILQTGVKIE